MKKDPFRYYKNLFVIDSKLNKGLNIFQVILFIIICSFIKFFRINHIFSFFLSRKSETINDDRLAIAFSLNELKIYNYIKSFFGLKKCLVMNVEVDQEKDGEYVWISNKELFYSVLRNIDEVLEILNQSIYHKSDRINLIREIKNVGVFNHFKTYVEHCRFLFNFNDHSGYNVNLVDYVMSRKNETVYIQHAPVNERFPRLYHDYNILFSQQALEKYKAEDSSKSVFLFTDISLLILKDKFQEIDIKNNDILICLNKLDDISKVEKVCSLLIENKYSVTVRMHPADNRKTPKVQNLKISEGSSLIQDLNKNSIVITNESAIALEAIYFNKLYYKTTLFSETMDNYGFLNYGLILKEYTTEKQLIEAISTREVSFNKNKLNYYTGYQDGIKERLISIAKKILNEDYK